MIVYIAGKMRGLEDYGRANFAYAEELLRMNGHTVLNPAHLPINLKPEKYMPICLSMIEAADAVYMLNNWTDSEGAKIEHDYAVMQGKKIYSDNTIERGNDDYKDLLPRYEMIVVPGNNKQILFLSPLSQKTVTGGNNES